MSRPHLLFVTGRLAEPALRRTVAELSQALEFDYSVAVLPITVIALATVSWIQRHLQIPPRISRIILPGLCAGELSELAAVAGCPVERGPEDLRALPSYFGRPTQAANYGRHDIEILAEINHAPRKTRQQILAEAAVYQAAGADVIDLGCDPGGPWNGVSDTVRALRAQGHRVSIDSFDRVEAAAATAAGAELVLSVNRSNRDAAVDWGCEVVALPDSPGTLDGLEETTAFLTDKGVRHRLDPILEPIGFGFFASLERYATVRRRYPNAEILMGIGNLTELTEVDSAGVNVLLLACCQELGIRSVLTTQVANWCRSAVQELDHARKLVHQAVTERMLPKRLDPELVLLRDSRAYLHGADTLRELASRITDRGFRIFAEEGRLVAFNREVYLEGTDPFHVFEQLHQQNPVDPGHAFYLGYEMAKAITALTLGKNYVQDQALHWGFLTVPEQTHRGTIPEERESRGPQPCRETERRSQE